MNSNKPEMKAKDQKSYQSKTDNNRRAKLDSTQTVISPPWLEIKLTPGGWEELLRWQRRVFENFYALVGYPTAKQKRELRRLTKLAKLRKEGEAGVFFVQDGKLHARSSPWSVIPPFGGYRTYALGLWDFWYSLRSAKKVPYLEVPESTPRGRVSYHDATCQFAVYTDSCTAKNERWIRAIKKRFRLPASTKVVIDAHYWCTQCPDSLLDAGSLFWYLDADWNLLNTVIKCE